MEIDEPANVDDLVVVMVVYGWTYSPWIADRTLLVPALIPFLVGSRDSKQGPSGIATASGCSGCCFGDVPGRQSRRGGWCASDPKRFTGRFSLCKIAASSHHPRLRALQQKGGSV